MSTYDQLKLWDIETQTEFDKSYIDDQDWVKNNGQPGPKNNSDEFLELNNFQNLLKMIFNFLPESEKPLWKKRLPTIAKQWFENSIYKEQFGLVSLEEMNSDFVREQLYYINPLYVQRRMNEFVDDIPTKNNFNIKKEKFSNGKNAVKNNNRTKKDISKARGIRPNINSNEFMMSRSDDFVDIVADKNIKEHYSFAEYGGEYHDFKCDKTYNDAGFYREEGIIGNPEYDDSQIDGTYLENFLSRQIDKYNCDIPPDTRDVAQYRMNKYDKSKMVRVDQIHRRHQENNIDETLPQPIEWRVNITPKFRNRELYYRFKQPIIDDRCADYNLYYDLDDADSCEI